MTVHTRAFEGVAALLVELERRGLPWGIVTNKAERFTLPLVRQLAVLAGAQVVVGGDTTPHAKPHPAPLLEAARRLGLAPAQCLYVGDDERDIVAGRAAGMRTVAARYGYLGLSGDTSQWQADFSVEDPAGVLNCLTMA
jgi:phosphoglycolate phosphatase